MSAWALPYTGRRATVLGGAGFIGRWVIHELVNVGAQVTAVTRTPPAGRASATLHDPSDVVEWDLSQGSLDVLLDRTEPDIVFNLSGYGVDPSERDANLATRLNCEVVSGLCQALSDRPVSGWSGLRLVHVGSALEYGEAGGDLQEDTEPMPTTVYGWTKLRGTRAVEAAVAAGLSATTARLFTVYGPGEHPTRLLPTILSAADRSGEIPLTAGKQLRDFTYVRDVAEGLLRLGALPRLDPPTVNLATGVLTAVRDVVKLCAQAAGIEPERLAFGALPTRREEMEHQRVSLRRLRGYLDWIPHTPVKEGLRLTLAQAPGPHAGGGGP